MNLPPLLKKGDKVAIVAPAKCFEAEQLQFGISVLKSWGLEVWEGKSLYSQEHRFAGNDVERLNDLQQAFDNPEIKAIFAARGGYGTSRIIDQLNILEFNRTPDKWVVGFSDLTVLLSHLQTLPLDWPVVHGAMIYNWGINESISYESLKDLLFEGKWSYDLEGSSVRSGEGEAVLTGGNLAILSHLTASPSEVNYQGKLLFIEDIGEELYALDRMLVGLKRAGRLDRLAGLVVGQFSNMKDSAPGMGQTVEEIILNQVDEYNYPVFLGFPAGHERINLPLLMGQAVKWSIGDDRISLSQ